MDDAESDLWRWTRGAFHDLCCRTKDHVGPRECAVEVEAIANGRPLGAARFPSEADSLPTRACKIKGLDQMAILDYDLETP